MYLFGANGHGKVILEIAEKKNLVISAFIDFDTDKIGLLGYKILHEIPDTHIDIVISIGANIDRKIIAQKYSKFKYHTLIHPNASVSKRCKIDQGTVVMAGVAINSEVEIGKHCIINTNASIDHDCVIQDFVHISPNVH